MKQLQTARPRNTCPNCGSLSLRKKVMIGSYVCEICDWHGRIPVKKMVSTRHLIPTEDRIKHLAKVHAAHPDWKKKDLRRIETEQIVDLYLKGGGLLMVSRQYVFKQVSAEDGDRISLPFYAGKIRILPSNEPETKDTIAWIEPAPGLRNFAADYLNQTALIIGLMFLVFLLSLAFIAAVHYYAEVI